MLAQIGVSFDPERIVLSKELDIWGVLVSGVEAASSSNLFPRIDLPEISGAAGAGKPASKKKEAARKKKHDAPVTAPVTAEFSDFQKLEMRLGRILEAKAHPDADKLLILKVDLGEERPRQVVAGLAQQFGAPQDPRRDFRGHVAHGSGPRPGDSADGPGSVAARRQNRLTDAKPGRTAAFAGPAQ
jgi:methionyl-tRNA synthetase